MALIFARRLGLQSNCRSAIRLFSTTNTSETHEKTTTESKESILDVKHAMEHCSNNVKKFDYAAFRVGAHFPEATRPHYFAINAFFLEVLRSREISRERSICQTRLHWWRQTLDDVDAGRTAREPLARMLGEVKRNTRVNFKLLHRIVDY